MWAEVHKEMGSGAGCVGDCTAEINTFYILPYALGLMPLWVEKKPYR